MSQLCRIPAPAKVNVFLRVTEKRCDGYHNLVSCMAMIDWCDYLTFTARSDGVIERLDRVAAQALPATDLCIRAAQALKKFAAMDAGVTIELEKNIPQQAGLGGGSSDCATTLLALNQLWGLHLSLETLLEVGLQLGADVPFFLFGQTAIATGVGEQLTAVTLPQTRLRVVFPGVGVSTAEVFARCRARFENPSVIITGFSQSADPWSYADNDLQAAAQALQPEIRQAFEALQAFGSPRMSGSGSAVFVRLQSCSPTGQEMLKQNATVASWHDQPGWLTRDCSVLFQHPASRLRPQ